MTHNRLTHTVLLFCGVVWSVSTCLANPPPKAHAPTLTEQIEQKMGALVRVKLKASPGKERSDAKVVNLSCDASTQTFCATFQTEDGQTHEARGVFVFQTNVPVLNASLRRHDPLSAQHIVWQRCDVSSKTQGALKHEAISTRKASLDLAPGTILTAHNTLEAPSTALLPRNTPVALLYKTRNITIRVGGARLKKAAHVGDIALVTNPFGTHKDTLHGRLNAASQVVIGSS